MKGRGRHVVVAVAAAVLLSGCGAAHEEAHTGYTTSASPSPHASMGKMSTDDGSMGGMAMDGSASASPDVSPPAGCKAGTPTAAEMAYVEGMVEHHAQALTMVRILTSKKGVPYRVSNYARYLAVNQGAEIGDMRAWVTAWREALAGTACGRALAAATTSAMNGMGHMGSKGSMDAMGQHGQPLMPGMLSAQQLRGLRAKSGTAEARDFVTLMIQHHQGAITMSLPVRRNSPNSWVHSLALHVVYGQSQEIRAMKRMLAAL